MGFNCTRRSGVRIGVIRETAGIRTQSHLAAVKEIRNRVAEFAGFDRFSPEDVADLALAVGEACSNAIKHGSPLGEADEIAVALMRTDRSLVIEVSDSGHGFDPDALPQFNPGLPRTGGMGIHLMHSLMDVVEYRFGPGTTVRLVKLYHPNGR